MSDIYKRGISGLIYVLLFTASIIYSEESYLFIIYFFGLACIREFLKLIHLKNYVPYLLFSAVTYIVLFERNLVQGELIALIVALTGSIQLLIMLFSKKTKYPQTIFHKLDISIRYLLLSLCLLMLLPFYYGSYEPYLVLSIVIMIWTNDSFAFLVGKNLGKHKLFPSVSPKKTIEGFIGGVVFTLLASYFIHQYFGILSLTDWIVIGCITSVLGTFGDLVESKFKRQANVKDSGHIMPGHGGLLDRLDSLLFVAPFVYLYLNYII